MEIVWKMAKDKVIVVETKTRALRVDGKVRHRGFAAILTFENGKIIRDHTHMKDAQPLSSTSENQ